MRDISVIHPTEKPNKAAKQLIADTEEFVRYFQKAKQGKRPEAIHITQAQWKKSGLERSIQYKGIPINIIGLES